jgi:hypothetical protein
MISTDTSGAIDFIDKGELQKNIGNAERALKMVQSGTGLGSESSAE